MDCSLDAGQIEPRLAQWSDLRSRALSINSTGGVADRPDSGVVMRFPTAAAADVRELAQAERICCAFLTIETDERDDEVELRISSPDPGGDYLVAILAGRDPGPAPDSGPVSIELGPRR